MLGISVSAAEAATPSELVCPFVGTTNFGATNPGAVLPWGMMSVSPFNVTGSSMNRYDKDARWWSTPFEFTNSYFTGFSHVNLSGVGCPEGAAIITTATSGDFDPDYHNYGSRYASQVARPGYYGLTLTDQKIQAAATVTQRTSREAFTFTEGGTGSILLNLGVALSNEVGATVRRVSDTEIEGSRLLGTFCYNPGAVFPVYFVARVSRVPAVQGAWKMQPALSGVEAEWTPDNGKYKLYDNYTRTLSGDDIGYRFTYTDLRPGETIELSLAISFVSIENARENLLAEQPQGTTLTQIADAASSLWNDELGKVTVSGGTEEQQRVFYTALYHSLIHPSVISDVCGEYPAMESGATAHCHTPRYSVFSLWDTYRCLHQLLTLVYPDRQLDMLRTMTAMASEWGWLPKWELFGRETWTMEGDPATCVIVDSWRKGLKEFDIDTAYEAMVKSATTRGADNLMRPDIDPYAAKGYIPMGYYAGDLSGDNSVSHALEYYVADAALASLARERGDASLADTLERRSHGWQHYFDASLGCLRPLNADGTFLSPFDPADGANFSNAPGFHEGSAWNYSFALPHDVDSMIAAHGGADTFCQRLQTVFDSGLYDPANEPDIAYAYLFNHVPGQEWRTSTEVDRILARNYTTAPDGIPGNDDCGTMSAWAVWSMLGLYPECPGTPTYTLTAPTFDNATVKTAGGTLTITAERLSPSARHIKEVTLDGRKIDGFTIDHADITNGDHTLHFTLEVRPVEMVDPKIGSGDHGHVFVGANVPFGMVMLGPTSFPQSWDWCSGYHDTDSTLIGFSHTHLSGTGIGDLFDVTILPVTSAPKAYTREGLTLQALRSTEQVRPGYYAVDIDNGVKAQMSATARVGISRYTYPDSVTRPMLVINLEDGGCWDAVTESSLHRDSAGRLLGLRRSKGWANDQYVYFAIEFSRAPASVEARGKHHHLLTWADNSAPITVKVGISPNSEAAAVDNLQEITDFNLERVAAEAYSLWDDELQSITVESDNEADLRTFYTALYHSYFFPATFSDRSSTTPAYTIYSLWDTYRAEMPLLSITQPKRYPQMINSMLDIFDRQGRLPVWHLWGNETDCMVGNPGIIPVADAVVKHVDGVDTQRALRAMIATANDTARGGGLRQHYGYIPNDLFSEGIAYDMEYAIADGAIANAARTMGRTDVADEFTRRSHSWRNYFDASTGFVRGKMADGSWRTPFDPNFASHRVNDYCEGNAWQYTWLAPQDVDGIIAAHGSREAAIAALDSLFTTDAVISGEDASPDISGLIGQYAHGNEPVHHVIYLYTMLGAPDHAADRVRQTLNELYFDAPAGLSGNEDAGQMSAWYVLSSLGFYQPEPAGGRYWFGWPKWRSASVKVPGGEMRITKDGDGAHISSVELNGTPLNRLYITHDELMAGGTLRFIMKD
jgi:predicted alpha-1,2-mannosidase